MEDAPDDQTWNGGAGGRFWGGSGGGWLAWSNTLLPRSSCRLKQRVEGRTDLEQDGGVPGVVGRGRPALEQRQRAAATALRPESRAPATLSRGRSEWHPRLRTRAEHRRGTRRCAPKRRGRRIWVETPRAALDAIFFFQNRHCSFFFFVI